MLDGMAKAKPSGPREWSVYLVRCGDGSYYTGIAKDVAARIGKHNSGAGAAYTRSRRPVELVARREGFSRAEALVCEAWVKTLAREKKPAALSKTRIRRPAPRKTGAHKKRAVIP